MCWSEVPALRKPWPIFRTVSTRQSSHLLHSFKSLELSNRNILYEFQCKFNSLCKNTLSPWMSGFLKLKFFPCFLLHIGFLTSTVNGFVSKLMTEGACSKWKLFNDAVRMFVTYTFQLIYMITNWSPMKFFNWRLFNIGPSWDLIEVEFNQLLRS